MTATVVDLPVPAAFEQLPTRELETELLSLAGHIAAAQCRFLQMLAEFDQRGGWVGVGIRSFAHWLSWRAGMSLRTATEHVRIAKALQSLPTITEAFAAGRISYSKVRALTRVVGTDSSTLARLAAAAAAETATAEERRERAEEKEEDAGRTRDDAPEPLDPAGPAEPGDTADTPDPEPARPQVADPEVVEQALLNLALSGTASHVETVVRAVRRRQTPPEHNSARRGLSWHWDDTGGLVVRARLTPDEGAAFVEAIEELVPPQAPVRRPAPPVPADLPQRSREKAPGPATDRVAARRADALLALVVHEDAGDDPERAPAVSRGPARLLVHVEAATGAARIDGGPELHPRTLERLACDARVQLLLSDRTTNRLYLGRSRRLASAAQITAPTIRDGTRCQFPGCPHTRYLHAHHVRPWLRGGPTDIDNLVLLCGFHHRVLHEHGYRVHRDADGWHVLRPDGTPVPSSGDDLNGDAERLVEMNTRAHLQIDRYALTPEWYGEPLDPRPILDTLLPPPEAA